MTASGKWITLAALLGASLLAPPVQSRDTRCKMTFSLDGWSILYKTAKGTGIVRCDNGQRMSVKLRAKGGGPSLGKTRIEDGIGAYTGVDDIHDVLGHYGTAEAHAGADKAAAAQIVTKGKVSLALSGKGKGWSLGVAFGAFIIER